jgi:hypothetical protein
MLKQHAQKWVVYLSLLAVTLVVGFLFMALVDTNSEWDLVGSESLVRFGKSKEVSSPSIWTISSETQENGILITRMKSGEVNIVITTPLQGHGLCEGEEVCPYDFPTVANANLGTFHLAVAKSKNSYMASSPNSSEIGDKTVEFDASGDLSDMIETLNSVVKTINVAK